GVLDLQCDRGRIVIGLSVVGHRHDAGFEIPARRRYRLPQVRGEGGGHATGGKRISDEGWAAERRHVRTPTISLGFDGCAADASAYLDMCVPLSSINATTGCGPG